MRTNNDTNIVIKKISDVLDMLDMWRRKNDPLSVAVTDKKSSEICKIENHLHLEIRKVWESLEEPTISPEAAKEKAEAAKEKVDELIKGACAELKSAEIGSRWSKSKQLKESLTTTFELTKQPVVLPAIFRQPNAPTDAGDEELKTFNPNGDGGIPTPRR